MPQLDSPEFNEAMRRLSKSIDDCTASMRNFKIALDSSDLPETILDAYEELELLRRQVSETEH